MVIYMVKLIEIEFIEFIREDIKFNTVKELINQIEKDVKYIKTIN